MQARALAWLRNVGLALFVASLVAGIFLPVYADEIGWRLQERAAFDGVDKLYTELCGPNTLATPPFWMMPARYYSALFNSLFPDPLYVRLSGILYALAWTAMLLVLVRRVAGDARERTALTTMAIGFLSLGTMPLMLVWSRPEQPILLALTGAMLIATRTTATQPADARTAWLRSLALLAIALVALSYHIKAIFGLPLFLACLVLASRGSKAHLARALVAIVLVAATAWAAHYWIDRLQCPGNAAVRADFTRNNTGAALISASGWSQILPLIGQALNNVSLFQYLGMPAPRPEPMSYWLPWHRIDLAQSFAFFLVIVSAWLLALVFALWGLAVAAWRSWRARQLDERIVLPSLLLVTVLGWSASQGFRNVYEALFVVPLTVLAVVLAFPILRDDEPLIRRWKAGVTTAVGALGVISIPLVAALYAPPLARAAGERGYVSAQPYSVGVFGYGALKPDILATARQCGIVDADRNRALLIDDTTYFTFMKSRLPEHRQGLFSDVVADVDPIAYLRGIRSDGLVVSCQNLPPELRARAKSVGKFCCLGPPGW